MNFKSWKDYYLFVKEFVKYSCLNCRYGTSNGVEPISSKDIAFASHFCTYYVAMVRWDLQGFICQNWESYDGETLPDDDELFTIDEHILKKLEKGNKKWSIEEIRELL